MHSLRSNPRASTEVPFADSRDHLRAEMAWVESILKREVVAATQREGRPSPIDEFAGMYVSQEEIQRFVDEPTAFRTERDGPSRRGDPAGDDVVLLRNEIDRRIHASLAAGVDLRLPALRDRLELSADELHLLLFCLAPDVDVRFHRCFAFLQNEVGRRRPSVQFLARLVGRAGDVIDLSTLLTRTSPLLHHQLLALPSSTGGTDPPLPIQQPVVTPNVSAFLLGHDVLDEELTGIATLVEPRALEMYGSYCQRHIEVVEHLAAQRAHADRLPLAYVGGPPGSLRGALVESLARVAMKRVLVVDIERLLATREPSGSLWARIGRDVRMHDCALHLANVDALVTDEGRAHEGCAALRAFLEAGAAPETLLTGTRGPAEIGSVLRMPLAGFELPHPTIEERSEIWTGMLDSEPDHESERVIDALAAKFKFTPGQIRAAVETSASYAGTVQDGAQVVSIADLHRTCREASGQRLLALARKIVPKYGWDDIVLPADTLSQLREICGCVRNRRTVYGAWGFESRFSVGNGLNILFAGPSGTGKTMSAEIVAADLELDLYKIDLSSVVSKFVGETERNLEKIFEAAETSNSILFFDEADALFGKRSEVKDAHDRYANIEINYLLQKMDEHEGFVILATNLRGNMDAAFTRRLTYVVTYPFPDIENRRRIWDGVFPRNVPLAADVSLDFLARKFEFSGGNIKNVAINGAFLAAEDEGEVGMAHLIRAVKREYQKLGKVCSKSQLGPYQHLVRSGREAV